MDSVIETGWSQHLSPADFSIVANAIPVLCWMADSSGHIFWLNKRWHDYCGTDDSTQSGLNWEHAHDPSLLPEIKRQYEHAILAGEPFELVFPLKRYDGIYREFLTRASPVRDDNGQIIRWVGMNTDISELKETQKAAEKAKEQIDLALNSGTILGTWVWDIRSDLLSADERFANTFGLDARLCQDGLSFNEVVAQIHPDDLEKVSQLIQEAVQKGGPYSAEYRVRRSDGTYVWIEANGRCEHDDRGASRFPGVLIDISRRREAEQETHRATAAVQRAYNVLNTVMESVPALIYMKDCDGRFLLANSHSLALLGHSWDEVQGRRDADFLAPDQAEHVRSHDLQVLEQSQVIEIEEVVGHLNGRPRIWLSRKAPFWDENGNLAGIIGTSIEITERKQAEETRQLLVRELHHRVKNIFALVSSIVRLSYRKTDDPALAGKAIVDRINALAVANDLILPSFTHGSMTSVASLGQLIRTVLSPHISNWSRCRIMGPEVILGVQGSTTMALAFSELVTNAIKYGALSCETGMISITWRLEASHCLIEWKETGGPAIVAPAKKGFGSDLLVNGLKGSLGGDVTYDWQPTGAVVTLRASVEVLAQ